MNDKQYIIIKFLYYISMSDCGTPQDYGGDDAVDGGFDFVNSIELTKSYFSPIHNGYVFTSGAAMLPILIQEPLRSSSTFVSSSQSRLLQVDQRITSTTASGARTQRLGPLDDILGDVTSLFGGNLFAGLNITNSATTASQGLTALTTAERFSTEIKTFFVDFINYGKLIIYIVNDLNVQVSARVVASVDNSFTVIKTIGQSSANPYNVAAGSSSSQTLTDPYPLIQLRITPSSTPTSGTISAWAMMR